MILHRKTGNFIAVRKGRSISNTIFESWEYAKDHLGPESEFEEFGDIHEAAKYAFGRDDRQVATTKQTLSPVFDGLSQDILNHIFSFACSKEIDIDSTPCSGSISTFIPSMALVSKSFYRSSVAFVRQVPCILTLVFGSISMKKVWNNLLFFTRNRALLETCTIKVLQEPIDRITTSIFAKVIDSFDLSSIRNISIPYTPSKLSDMDIFCQFDLVKCGLPLDVFDRAASINEGFLITELANKLSSAEAGSLHTVEMQLDIHSFSEMKIFTNCDGLEDLTLHLYRPLVHRKGTKIPSNIEIIETIHAFIQNLPKLKKLKITSSLDDGLGLKISSNTLESLLMHESASNIYLQKLHCPLIHSLKVGMHLKSSLDPLVSCHGTVKDLSLRCHSTFADVYPMLRAVEKMSQLKKIDLVIEVPCTLNFKSTTVEDITICGIGSDIRLSNLECPVMKRAELTFDNFNAFSPFALRNSSTSLENLTILCIDELDEHCTQANVVKLDQLNKTVQQNMPRLKTLDLAIGEIEVTFVRDDDSSRTDLQLEMRRGSSDITFHSGLECMSQCYICECNSK